jgi:hypothetical protein
MKSSKLLITIIVALTLLAMFFTARYFLDKNDLPKELENFKSSQKIIEEKDLGVASFKITTEPLTSIKKTSTTDDLLDTSYHKKTLLSNKIWSSVPASGQLPGSYFFPFGIQMVDGGLIVDVPSIMGEEKLVQSNISRNGFFIKGSNDIVLARELNYSDLGLNLDFLDNSGNVQFALFIARGVPLLRITKEKTSQITIENGRFLNTILADKTTYQDESNELIISKNLEAISPNKLNYNGNGNIVIAANEKNNLESREILKKKMEDFNLQNIWAEYKIENNQSLTEFNFIGDNDNIFGLLTHQKTDDEVIFTIQTIRGPMKFVRIKNNIRFAEQLQTPPTKLETNFTKEQKDELLKLLQIDANQVKTELGTSYFGAKNLAKIARLLEIATELKEYEIATNLQSTLRTELENWFTYTPGEAEKYFLWNQTTGQIIAQKPEFGSEESNDHHFHYGYFLYAATVLGQLDSQFINNYQNFVNLLILDVANTNKEDKRFPYLRNFDFYESHSWASGLQPFASGNNQESTSEAINMYYSLYRWGVLTGQEILKDTGLYLYNQEVLATKTYWLNDFGSLKAISENYEPNKIGILWSSKYEYATFFDGSPLAVEGIQYLPITPGSVYLNNPARIDRDYDYLQSKGISLDKGPLVDYNIAYYSIVKGWDVITPEYFNSLVIDDGNSQTNLYHWISYWDSQK